MTSTSDKGLVKRNKARGRRQPYQFLLLGGCKYFRCRRQTGGNFRFPTGNSSIVAFSIQSSPTVCLHVAVLATVILQQHEIVF